VRVVQPRVGVVRGVGRMSREVWYLAMDMVVSNSVFPEDRILYWAIHRHVMEGHLLHMEFVLGFYSAEEAA
jgi:hypothetical protein